MAELEYHSSLYIQDMANLKEEKIWTTKDGEEMSVEDMTDSHLANTINMLIRNNSDKEWIEILENEVKRRQELNTHSKYDVKEGDLMSTKEKLCKIYSDRKCNGCPYFYECRGY